MEETIVYLNNLLKDNDTVVIGRTWEEFTDLQSRIIKALPAEYWLVVYVHNLSYADGEDYSSKLVHFSYYAC